MSTLNRVVYVRMGGDLLMEASEYADTADVSVPALMRLALREHLNKHKHNDLPIGKESESL